MQIIKDNQIIDNTWNHIADDDGLKPGDITVSLPRWQKDKKQLLDRKGNIGIRIRPGDVIDEIADDLDKVQLIELDFPALADGRLFSQAWLLRGRYRYRGEIRAIGHYLPDQVFYLSRVGVNAFSPERQEDLALLLTCLNDFSIKYQSSIN